MLQEDGMIPERVRQELFEETQEILKCLDEKDQELFRRIFPEEEPEKAGGRPGIGGDNVCMRFFCEKKGIRRKIKERERACV